MNERKYKEEAQGGPGVLRELKTMRRILNWFWKETGTQQSDAKIGVTCSPSCFPVKNPQPHSEQVVT